MSGVTAAIVSRRSSGSGRYYLVAFDVKQHDWRLFALDAIVGLPAKAGTVRTWKRRGRFEPVAAAGN